MYYTLHHPFGNSRMYLDDDVPGFTFPLFPWP